MAMIKSFCVLCLSQNLWLYRKIVNTFGALQCCGDKRVENALLFKRLLHKSFLFFENTGKCDVRVSYFYNIK